MKTKRKFILLFIILLFTFLNTGFTTSAHNEDDKFNSKKPMSLEEVYKVKGYTKNIDEKIEEFEKRFDTEVMLPKIMPFKINKSFAKVTEDKMLSLHFVGENRRDLFQFTINPNQPYKNETNYQLKNGKKVFIEEINPPGLFGVRQIYIKEGDFEYILGINDIQKHKKETLLKVSESLK